MDSFLLLPSCSCCGSYHSFQSHSFLFLLLFFVDESDATPGDEKLHDHWENTRVVPMLAEHVTQVVG